MTFQPPDGSQGPPGNDPWQGGPIRPLPPAFVPPPGYGEPAPGVAPQDGSSVTGTETESTAPPMTIDVRTGKVTFDPD